MPPSPPLQVAVCGAGAFGRNHIRIYRELASQGFPVRLAAIVDPAPSTLAAHQSTGVALFPTVEACQAALQAGTLQLHAASVCVPTSHHHAASAALLASGLHLLIEKPITPTLAQADHLIALAREHQRTIQVGHLERFNPAVQALAPLTHHPMFFEAHRLSLFSPRALDVDVVLDLMIHDLDVVLHLAQSPVREVRATGLPILSPHTDIANARVEFESGAVANFTASRVSTERVRKLRFFQPHQYLSVDYARQDLLVVSVNPQAAAALLSPAPANGFPTLSAFVSANPTATAAVPNAATGPSLQPLTYHKPNITPGEPLRLEIESFLQSILESRPPTVSAQQARAALALALQVQSAIDDHTQFAQLTRFLPS